MKEGEVSQPVKGAAGSYVLLRVTRRSRPPVNQSARGRCNSDAIKKDLALQQATGKLADIINAFEDARSGGADILPRAAKKAGMKDPGHIASVDKNGLRPGWHQKVAGSAGRIRNSSLQAFAGSRQRRRQ